VAQLHQRHILDAWFVIIFVTLGFMFFYTFVGKEGAKYFRLRTEMELAARVQAELVPPLHLNTAALEIYGRSIPSSSVGGDLVDVVSFNDTVTCYLADVSGHGIAAGVLMSMVKSALRTVVFQGASLVEVLQCLNRVLLNLKAPSMYVTLACIRSVDSSRLEYSLAGHPPILHYRRSTQTVSQLKMEQLPIALFGTAKFQSSTVAVESGDLLVSVSDGFLEITNRAGEDFGWERLETLVVNNAIEPLARIAERLVEETSRFGRQEDDQSILLIKVVSS
jgi:serine phosphatase RsbU (regulator of sigma subunit)